MSQPAVPTTITTELPQHILFYKILPRVPAKSLLPCMCVSKQWRLFLKSQLFAQMHLHRLTTDDDHQNHHKFLLFSTTGPCMFHTINCESPEDSLTAGRRVPFTVSRDQTIRALTSFDGLVFVGIKKFSFDQQYSDLILWNPLTGDYKKLSKAEENSRKDVYGLYYNSSDDDYKLLCVNIDCDAYIYSLKSDVWRKIDFAEPLKRIGFAHRWSPCTVVNEKLYFLNCVNYLEEEPFQEPLHGLTHSIIEFDTKTEVFMVIETPIPGNQYVRCLSHRGCLHLYVSHSEGTLQKTVELWSLMSGDGDWSKVVTYPINMYASLVATHPLHLMRDGKWLTHSEYDGLVFRVYVARRIKSYTSGCMYMSTSEKYIETLVSPNRYL